VDQATPAHTWTHADGRKIVAGIYGVTNKSGKVKLETNAHDFEKDGQEGI
jgi:hypothetical protein